MSMVLTLNDKKIPELEPILAPWIGHLFKGKSLAEERLKIYSFFDRKV
jgi:hypothetical protein